MVFIIVVGVLVGLGFVSFFAGIVRSMVRGGRPTGPYSGTHPTQLSAWQQGTTPYGIDTAVPPHGGHHGGGHHGGHHQHHDIGSTPTHTSHDMGGGGHHHG